MENKITRRNIIINNSFKEMYLKGFNGCSVNDLAKAAKIPKGSFYNYFESKEQYAVKAIEYYNQINKKDFDLLADKNEKPLDRIKTFYLAKISKTKNFGIEYGCFVGNLSEEVGGVDLDIAFAASNFHQEIENKIFNNLVEARENKELFNDLNENVIASIIVRMWQGVLLRTKVSHNSKYLLEFYEVLDKKLLI